MTSPASDLAAELSSRQMARDAKMATDESYSDWATNVLRKHPKARIAEERMSGGGYAKVATLDGRVVGKWQSPPATGYASGGNGGGWVADSMATDPPVSEAQARAMHAAAAGKSTLGIPKKVGEEFVGKDAPLLTPMSRKQQSSFNRFEKQDAEREQKKRDAEKAAANDASGVRIVHNRLLGGWYVVRGPHDTPLNGRFDSKEEAQNWLRTRGGAQDGRWGGRAAP